VTLRRRYYQCRVCPEQRGYAADGLLGCEERLTRLLRSHLCRLGSDVSFAQTAEHLQALLGVPISAESCRTCCEREAARMTRYEQRTPAEEFPAAEGEVEFQTDAVKVNTVEEGWKDLKIAAFLKRPRGEAATVDQWESRQLPAPTALVAWGAIAPIKSFRRSWRRRAKQLGIAAGEQIHALGDGASWIWNALERALSGSRQTLDVFHAAQKFAGAGKGLYGEGTQVAKAVHERGRLLLLEKGWDGVTTLVGEELQKEDTPRRRKVLEKMMNYFAPHAGRLNYAQQLQEGRSIGSGAIEGLAKTLGWRLKKRGARWKRKHVQPMTALIHLRHSPRWRKYWEIPTA
jgi:hypothetical protein